MHNKPTELIIVPGHAAFKKEVSLPLPSDIEKDDLWVLQSFQAGEPPFYIEHIKSALELADNASIVVFSGGRTRLESGRAWSEAKTYYEIAKLLSPKLPRVELEEYARDSFQNLDYSVRKFKSLTCTMPTKIFVVGWAFKAERYHVHAKTLGVTDTFEYLGVNNPSEDDLQGALKGERATLEQFEVTPRGDSGPLLDKRLQRDPWGDGEPQEY